MKAAHSILLAILVLAAPGCVTSTLWDWGTEKGETPPLESGILAVVEKGPDALMVLELKDMEGCEDGFYALPVAPGETARLRPAEHRITAAEFRGLLKNPERPRSVPVASTHGAFLDVRTGTGVSRNSSDRDGSAHLAAISVTDRGCYLDVYPGGRPGMTYEERRGRSRYSVVLPPYRCFGEEALDSSLRLCAASIATPVTVCVDAVVWSPIAALYVAFCLGEGGQYRSQYSMEWLHDGWRNSIGG